MFDPRIRCPMCRELYDEDRGHECPSPKAVAQAQRTHWEGCWKDLSHADCARARVIEIEGKLGAVSKAAAAVEHEFSWCQECGFTSTAEWAALKALLPEPPK